MDGKMLARLGAIIFISVVIAATVIEMTRKEESTPFLPTRFQQPERDALREDQHRCQQLGQQATEDSGCLRTWAKTRDRFLGRALAPSSPTQIEGR